jgi:parvulin-like peptidyl-prolyl isomerase
MQAESLPQAIQNEVARVRETVAETKRLLPDADTNWFFYDTMIAMAERAVREQDTVAMLRILPELQEME